MRKYILNLIILCMLISLIGVGFATWNAIDPTDDVNTGNTIISDDLMRLNLLSNNVFDSSLLKYNKNGFYEEGVYDPNDKNLIKVVKNSVVNYSVDVDLATCRDKIKDIEFIELRFTLIDKTNYKNILEEVYRKVIPNVSGMDGLQISTYSSSEKLDIYVKISLKNTLTSTTVKLKLDFKDVDCKDYFELLASTEKNKAFSISASLYAVYE